MVMACWQNTCTDLLLHLFNLLPLGCGFLLQLNLASFMLFSILCETPELEPHRGSIQLTLTLAAFCSLVNASSCLCTTLFILSAILCSLVSAFSCFFKDLS